jgi:hypothetical protein
VLVLARRYRLAAIILATAVAGCTVAYKTNILRKDVLTDAQNAIAETEINHGDMTITGSVDREDTTYDTGQPITLSVKVSKDAHVAVKITAPDKSGIVLFLFVASIAGDSWLFKRGPDKDSDFADLGVTSRAIAKDIVSSLKVGKGPDTVATYVTIRVGGGLF